MTVEAPTTLKGKLAWIGAMLLVAVWMFVLGIMVGRSTAPFDRINASIQEKLAELKAGPQGQEPPGGPGKPDPDISMTDLNFYEKLKETEPAPPPKIPAAKPIKPVAPEPPKEKKPASPQPAEAPAPKTEPAKMAESTPPPKREAPPPSPSASAPEPASASTAEHFTVQVAAVKNAEGAAKLIDQLREKGFDAYQISSQAQNGETWYRIRVGAYNTRTEAQSTASRLSKMNFNGMVLATP